VDVLNTYNHLIEIFKTFFCSIQEISSSACTINPGMSIVENLQGKLKTLEQEQLSEEEKWSEWKERSDKVKALQDKRRDMEMEKWALLMGMGLMSEERMTIEADALWEKDSEEFKRVEEMKGEEGGIALDARLRERAAAIQKLKEEICSKQLEVTEVNSIV
jgi:pyrrolidone-carboxylate peptidase